MRFLLDTHIFLWFISKDKQVSTTLKTAICEADEVYLSVVSVLEVVIKQQLGQLPLPQAAHTYLPIQRQKHLIDSLEISEFVASSLDRVFGIRDIRAIYSRITLRFIQATCWTAL